MAQSDFYRFSLGVGTGVTTSHADVYGSNVSSASKMDVSYYLGQFINVSVNYQQGKVIGGDVYKNIHHRQFVNDFSSIDLNLKLQLGAILQNDESVFLNIMQGLYVGTGIGGIQNRHKNPVRYQLSTGMKFPGYNRSKEMFVPFMAGINFHVPDKLNVTRVLISLNFQGNVVSGEGLDSYDTSGSDYRQGIPDIYTFLNFGISYHFGRPGWLSKR